MVGGRAVAVSLLSPYIAGSLSISQREQDGGKQSHPDGRHRAAGYGPEMEQRTQPSQISAT